MAISTLVELFNIEYWYLNPWHQINGATIDDIRFFYTTLLLKIGL